jgi:hypothetical protein
MLQSIIINKISMVLEVNYEIKINSLDPFG